MIIERQSGRMAWSSSSSTDGLLPKANHRKRSRNDVDTETWETIVTNSIQYMDERLGLFPTFKTLLDTRFYQLLAEHTEDDLFQQLSVFIAEFRKVLSLLDKALAFSDFGGFQELIMNDMVNVLRNCQQIILVFTMTHNKI